RRTRTSRRKWRFKKKPRRFRRGFRYAAHNSVEYVVLDADDLARVAVDEHRVGPIAHPHRIRRWREEAVDHEVAQPERAPPIGGRQILAIVPAAIRISARRMVGADAEAARRGHGPAILRIIAPRERTDAGPLVAIRPIDAGAVVIAGPVIRSAIVAAAIDILPVIV